MKFYTYRFVVTAAMGLALIASAYSQEEDPAHSKADQIINSPDEGMERPEGSMLVTASDEATFDSGKRIAVFLGTVTVDDEQFTMTADKLTVYLAEDGGGLKTAEAEGDVVIVQKADGVQERGESTAKAMKAVYDPETGDITLTGWPQVSQGINLHKASQFSTRMTLNQSGRLQTEGASSTFIQDKEARQQ